MRRLREGEGARIRELRLRALREAPDAFSSSLRMTLDRGRFEIENKRFPGHVTRGSYVVGATGC